MKRLRLAFTAGFAVLGVMNFAATSAHAADAAKGKVIGYYMDAADDYYKAAFMVFQALGTNAGWQVLDVVGQGTAPEQIAAVENFITQKVDHRGRSEFTADNLRMSEEGACRGDPGISHIPSSTD
jgi:ABC-type sugar transport system substrate-binding protein